MEGKEYDWYNPDIDIEETGGIRGMNLANVILEQRRIDDEVDRINRYFEAKTGPVEPITNRRKRNASNGTYVAFLGRAEQIPYEDVSAKRDALYTYFGGRFGSNGRTPVDDMEDWQVNGAFNGLIKNARQRSLE